MNWPRLFERILFVLLVWWSVTSTSALIAISVSR